VNVPPPSVRELEVVSGLRELGDTPTLDPRTRAEIRTRIGRRLRESARATRRDRAMRIFAGAAALVVGLAGLGTVLAHDALPGNPLYAVKRATESAELGLTIGDEARAETHLRLAATRLDELQALHSPNRGAIADFERQVRAGTAELTTLGVRGAGGELDELRSWVRLQTAKAVPFVEVTDLLVRIDARARALSMRLDCDRITSVDSDDLGVLPARGACRPPGAPRIAPAAPLPAPESPAPPATVESGATRSSESGSDLGAPAVPTGPVPPASGTPAPSAADAPILAPTSARVPGDPASPSLLPRLGPLLWWLPGIGIG
jgi:uncharacterized protein DUF5667